jgi:hypothetical protein
VFRGAGGGWGLGAAYVVEEFGADHVLHGEETLAGFVAEIVELRQIRAARTSPGREYPSQSGDVIRVGQGYERDDEPCIPIQDMVRFYRIAAELPVNLIASGTLKSQRNTCG